MSPYAKNLVLGWLRDLDSEMDAILVDLLEIRVGQERLGVDIESLRSARSHSAGVSANLQVQIDRLSDKVERINRQLDIVDA